MRKYDLVVIGAGPGGEKAAVKAAYFGYKVAIIEKAERVGGAGIHTGTLPSKTLKETALYFSGKQDKGLYGVDRSLTRTTSLEDFMYRKDFIQTSEAHEMHENLVRHKLDILKGEASFVDENTVCIHHNGKDEHVQSEYFVIATGSYPYHPPGIPFDGKRVLDSDTILKIEHFPKSICVVGAGVIGCEYATIFSAMGTKVYLVNNNDKILPFLDDEISSGLVKAMAEDGIKILFNTSIDSVDVPEKKEDPLTIHLKDSNPIKVDMFLYAAGRCGNSRRLKCENAGVKIGKREAIEVDKNYMTNVPNIYAIGDVIGFPALASTSMDQGRVAVSHIFNIGDLNQISQIFPYGIYTIPEVSCVGITEGEAKAKGLDYCVGHSQYRNMPRGKIMGAESGFLKVIFTKEDMVIRGVHIIGKIASELIHYGVTLVENERTVHHVVSSIFNYPTLHDLYKYACYDGLGNFSGHKMKV